ncbi:MAG TPA: sigma factor-like helix-turn-helix DNA-binding protein, partial [Planctomycetota bacterium]|nr:sigma factor-like helix-turn-helix DNA-binding protein [Planctomycetota bacterium]
SAPDRAVQEELEGDTSFSRAELEAALDRLTPEAARTIRAKHFEGLDFEGIATRAGLPLNTVKARYYRGLARLREILDRELRRKGA